MTEQTKILEIEVALTKRFRWKDEWKHLITFGVFDLFETIELFGKHMIEVTSDYDVYHVQYRQGKEVTRWQLPLTFEEFRQVLEVKNMSTISITIFS